MSKNDHSKWITECWNELDAVESTFAESPFDNAPEWVEASTTEVVLSTHRTLKRKTGRKSNAQILGATVGYQEVLLDYIDRLEEEDSDTDEQLPDTLTEFYEQHKEKIDSAWEVFRKICREKKKVLKNCRMRASEKAPLDERLAFYKAYTKAREQEAAEIFDKISPREKVNFALTMNSHAVQNMRNRSEVRRFIVQCFGKPGVYNDNLIQDACKDVGLNLANRGRPEK